MNCFLGIRANVLMAAAIIPLLTVSAPAQEFDGGARTSPESDTGATSTPRQRFEFDHKGLEVIERRRKDLLADLNRVAAERERINARLVEMDKLVQQSEGQLSVIEPRLGELEVQEKHLRETLEARHGSISALLGATMRMGRNPPPPMVASREDVLSAFRSGTLLTPVLRELGEEAKALSEQLNDLKRVMTSIRTEGDKLRAETGRLNDARMRLAALQDSKRRSHDELMAELTRLGFEGSPP